MAELIKMSSGIWTQVCAWKHVMPCSRWAAHWEYLANTTELSICGGDAGLAVVKVLLPLVMFVTYK